MSIDKCFSDIALQSTDPKLSTQKGVKKNGNSMMMGHYCVCVCI